MISLERWPLIGREEQLERILLTLAREPPGNVIVAGEAGVGKSALSLAACERAREQGMTIARVLATESGNAVPLSPFAHLIPDSSLAQPADRLALFRLASQRLAAWGDGRPLLLQIEDAHLLDPASAALALHIVGAGVARLIATIRTGEPCPDAIVALWKEGHAERIELPPLTREQTREVLEQALDGRVGSRLLRWIFELSDGNALFVRELVLSAIDAGALTSTLGRWDLVGEPALSVRLRELLGRRVSGVTAEERELLELVALAEPLDLDAAEWLVSDSDAPERAERRGVLVTEAHEGLKLRFAHPLYREAVAESLGALRVRKLSGRLVDAFERRDASRTAGPLQLARWRLDAGAGAESAWWLAAAREAERVFDNVLAARLARSALESGGGLPAALALAGALARSGQAPRAQSLLAAHELEARRAGQAPEYLSLRINVLHSTLGRTDEAHALLDSAAGWRQDEGWQLQIAALRVRLFSEQRRMHATLEHGLPLIAALGAGQESRRAASVVAYALGVTGRMEEADGLLERTFGLSELMHSRHGNVDLGALLAWTAVRLEGGTGWPELLDWARALHERALVSGDDQAAALLAGIVGAAWLYRADLRQAQDCLLESVRGLDMADVRGMLPHILGLLSQALALVGETRGASAAHNRGEELLAARLNQVGRGELDRGAVWIAAATGELSRARSLAMRAAQDASQAPVLAAVFLHDALRLGAMEPGVIDALSNIAASTDSPLTRVRARHASATLASQPEDLLTAAREFEEIGARLLAAEAHAQAGRLFGQQGLEAKARESAARSQALATVCGGARTPLLSPLSARFELTKREREIVTLAGGGLSNRLIAERLVISTRTVESHLYHAMDKLGVESRAELVPLVGGDGPGISGGLTAS
ncbi:MAG: ATP-binding protein [Solirubrobacteraceae bacterium]